MRPVLPPRAVLNLLLAAFTLRGFALERHSLSVDESLTWAAAVKPSLGETVFADPGEPPVWRVLTRIWATIFGDSETALRSLAALCGVVAVVLAWRLGRRLLRDPHMAMWFLAFAGLATAFVQISQEAGPYALLLLETLGLTLLYLRWLDHEERGGLVGYAALGAIALHTHLAAVLPLIALLVHGLSLAKRRVPLLLATGASALAIVPWLLHAGSAAAPTLTVPSGTEWLGVLRHVAAGPAITMEPPWSWITDLVWLPALLLGAWELARRPGARGLVALLLGFALLSMCARFGPEDPHRLDAVTLLGPWLWLVATVGAFALPGVLRWLALAALAALVGLGVVGYHAGTNALVPHGQGADLDGRNLAAELVPDPHDPTWFLHRGRPYAKDPWRDVHEFVSQYGRDDDLVVLSPGHVRPVWDYHDRHRRGGPLSVLALSDEILRLDDRRVIHIPAYHVHRELIRSHRRVLVITAHGSPSRDAWAQEVLAGLVEQVWRLDGSQSTKVPPIPFRHAEGLRISVISRER